MEVSENNFDENKNLGYVLLYRSIRKDVLWQIKPFSKIQAWLDLIISANHTDKKILKGNRTTVIQRGSIITSDSILSENWGWSRNKTRDFLSFLKKDNRIDIKRDNKGTYITICNYCTYQNAATTKSTTKGTAESTTKGTAEGTAKGTLLKNVLKNDIKNEERMGENKFLPGDIVDVDIRSNLLEIFKTSYLEIRKKPFVISEIEKQKDACLWIYENANEVNRYNNQETAFKNFIEYCLELDSPEFLVRGISPVHIKSQILVYSDAVRWYYEGYDDFDFK